MIETTTISIKSSTAQALRALGRMGDSYDDVIQRLLAGVKRNRCEGRNRASAES